MIINKNITFNPDNHTYFNEKNEQLISTTTIIKLYTPKFDETGQILQKCAARDGVEPAELRKEWDKKRDDAATKGTKFHKDIEVFIQTGKIRTKKTEDLVREFAKIKFKGKLQSETIIGSNKFGIAGTIDIIEDLGKNFISIHDIKTNTKKPNNSSYFDSRLLYPVDHLKNSKINIYSLQLSIYSLILEEEYGCFVKDLNLLYVDFEKRKITPIPVNYLREDALKMVRHYLSMKEW